MVDTERQRKKGRKDGHGVTAISSLSLRELKNDPGRTSLLMGGTMKGVKFKILPDSLFKASNQYHAVDSSLEMTVFVGSHDLAHLSVFLP